MEKFLKALGAIIVIAIGVFIGAILGGTILWWIWPYALPIAFPNAVGAGVLAANIPWWNAVCLTWLFCILIKSSQKIN
jgi:hypothetical protein